jgi:hypothetical protein
MEKFKIIGPPYDLSLSWRTGNIGKHIRYFKPERYDNHDLFGFMSPSGEGRVWAYYYDYSMNSGSDVLQHIMLHRFNTTTGVLDNSIAIEGIETGGANVINGIIVDKPKASLSDLTVTLNTALAGIQLGHVDIGNGVNVSLGNTLTITSEIATMPITRSYINSSGGIDVANTFMTYVETGSELNRISFADAITVDPTTAEHFSLPYRYSIDKTTRFGETYDTNQVNYSFAVASNPLNHNFFYIAYITSKGQIRVIKLYRFLPANQSNYVYILMWATVADGTLSPFMDASGDYTVETTSKHRNSLSMVTDPCGNLYVFCRKGTKGEGQLRMWKVREYLLDVGQDALGVTVHSDPTIFTDFLADVTDKYTILSQESSVYIGSFPSVNDVIISNVTSSGGNYHITFKYIDYNIFQSLYTLSSGLTIAKAFNADLIKVLEKIYRAENNISVLNFNSSTETVYDGTLKTFTVVIPAVTLIKPCIVRGTQVVAYDHLTGKPYITEIEKIQVGDSVINQDAKPIRVTHHTTDIISTNDWTTPYIIPPNYFGKDQPYSNLYISGDHGIRMTRQGSVYRLYPYTIKQGLKRIKTGSIVEYHHLKLENTNDFFIANGVLIEGMARVSSSKE